MIIVIGTIDIDPDRRDAFVDAVLPYLAATRQEADCEHYAISADLDDPYRFYLSERWATDEAVGAHATSPHFAAFMGVVGGLVRESSVTRWDGATATPLT